MKFSIGKKQKPLGDQQMSNEYIALVNHKLNHWIFCLSIVAFGFVLLGSKFWLIHTYGNATPFWDQWDAEALILYKSFLNGDLSLSILLGSHNEHRIFLPRLLNLFLFEINGEIWNPVFGMLVNSILHVVAMLVIVLLFLKVLGRGLTGPFLGLSLLIFVVPYGWENTLFGLASHTSLVLFFSVLGIWFLSVSSALSRMWWLGLIFVALSLLSFATGILVFLTASGVASSICLLNNRDRTLRQIFAVVIPFILFILVYLSFPILPEQAHMASGTIVQFYRGLTDVLGWPMPPDIVGTAIRNSPAALFVYWIYKEKPLPGDRRWFIFAMILWSFILALAIAKGRVTESMSSRYLDFNALSIITNFASLLWLIKNAKLKQLRWPIAMPVVWIMLVVIGFCSHAYNNTESDLARKKVRSLLQEENTKNYIKTNNMKFLDNSNPEAQAIPYPKAEKLAFILSLPEIRKILPANISEFGTIGRFDLVVQNLIAKYYLFIFFGMGLFALISVLDYKKSILTRT